MTAGGWLLSDQTRSDQLMLSSVGWRLPMAALLEGVESAHAGGNAAAA